MATGADDHGDLIRRYAGILAIAIITVGLLPHEYSTFDNVFHIALGLLNLAVAGMVGRDVQRRPQPVCR